MKNVLIFCCVLFAAMLSNNLVAQENSGRIYITKGSKEIEKKANGSTYYYSTTEARLETDQKNSPFHNAKGNCENWIMPIGKDNFFAHGMCVLADKDGDTFVTYSSSFAQDESIEIFVKGGTGKFKGLTGQGLASPFGPSKDTKTKDCCVSSWKGTFKL